MSKNKDNHSFIIQGSILAIAGILVRLIGLFYRVPLVNILGDEGSGIYSSAYNIYAILLLLSSSSLPLAISKMVAERASKGQYKNVKAVLRVSLIFSFFLGLVCFCIIFFGAGFFANVILNAPETKFAIRLLAPTIFIMAFLSTMRGFFQGLGSMVPTAISQVLEQIFNAVFSLVCAYGLFQVGLNAAGGSEALGAAYGAGGGTIGTTVGALVALITCVVLYIFFRPRFNYAVRQDSSRRVEAPGRLMKIIVVTAIPVTLSGFISNISTVLDQSFYGHYMSFVNQSDQYMKIWGSYSNIYVLLTTLPIAISSAVAMSMAPSIAAANVNNRRGELLSKIAMSVRFCMVIAIPATIGLTVLSGPIVRLMFPSNNGSAATMLLVGSIVVIFGTTMTITNAVLQGIGKMSVPIKNAVVALVLHLIFLVVALYGFKAGIYGVLFATVFFNIVITMLNLRDIQRFLGYRQEYMKTLILPLICSVIMGVFCYLTYFVINKVTHRNSIGTILAIIVAVIVYGIALLKLKCISEEEMYSLPMGGRLVRIAKKCRLM